MTRTTEKVHKTNKKLKETETRLAQQKKVHKTDKKLKETETRWARVAQ